MRTIQPQPDLGSFFDAYRRGQAMRREREAYVEQQQQSERDSAFAAVKSRAMEMLRTGDCKGAVDMSLYSNDINFAKDIKDFCTAPVTK